MPGRNLDDYVEVAARIQKFYEKFPNGSLRCKEIRSVEIDGQHYVIYIAQAFRTQEDQAPAEGTAWELVPGQTNFTRGSEVQNCETSAWGRAIAALGFEVKRGIASREEMAKSQAEADHRERTIGTDAVRRLTAQFMAVCPPEDSLLRAPFMADLKAKLKSLGIEGENVIQCFAQLLPPQAAEVEGWLAMAPEASETKAEINDLYTELKGKNGRRVPKGWLDAQLAGARSVEDLKAIGDHLREKLHEEEAKA